MNNINKRYMAQVVVANDDAYMERSKTDSWENYEIAEDSGDSSKQVNPEVNFSWGKTKTEEL